VRAKPLHPPQKKQADPQLLLEKQVTQLQLLPLCILLDSQTVITLYHCQTSEEKSYMIFTKIPKFISLD
jgi:hypothetical protein